MQSNRIPLTFLEKVSPFYVLTNLHGKITSVGPGFGFDHDSLVDTHLNLHFEVIGNEQDGEFTWTQEQEDLKLKEKNSEQIFNGCYCIEGETGVFILKNNPATNALQQNEDKTTHDLLQEIIDQSPDAIHIVTDDGALFYVNKTAGKRLGINRNTCRQFRIWDIVPRYKGLEDWKSQIELLKQSDKMVFEGVNRNVLTQNTFPVDITLRYKSIRGQFFTIANLTDITERKKAESRLHGELQMQELLIKIASSFINVHADGFDGAIRDALEKLGGFVQADRAYIFDYDLEKQTCKNTYEWCEAGITPEIDNLQDVPLEYIPQWVETHKRGLSFYVPSVDKLKLTDPGLYEVLKPQGIKSLLAVPLFNQSMLTGFIGFDSVKNHYKYTEREKGILALFGHMLINAKNRLRWEKEHFSHKKAS